MKGLLTAIGLLMFSAWAVAGTDTDHVIRLEVLSNDEDGTQVNVTLPLSMLYSFEDTIRDVLTDIDIDDHEINLKEIWATVKDTGPMDYVEIIEGDARIKVSTTESHIVVTTEGDANEKVNAMVPFALCDALFTTSEDFDFDRLMEVLKNMAGMDIVNVQADGESVRVWIE